MRISLIGMKSYDDGRNGPSFWGKERTQYAITINLKNRFIYQRDKETYIYEYRLRNETRNKHFLPN